MSLKPGSHLGSYEITAAIGAGGMGEVWKARDPNLGREVAIKVLPADFARDAERVARFQREAKLLASLNHPGIAVVHGLHEEDGRHFLAMELVAGEDLLKVLSRGPLPVDEALAVARQIAAALEAAHDSGVVHRDLKPANVVLTPDGRAKVLDFGLAKVVLPGSGDSSLSPTITAAGTAAGLILGTAAYMSPEQARGKPVDRRADVWAFGCLLYEILVGGKCFGGDTVSDAIARILEREPDWARLPAATPAPVRRLLRRCLEKDPARRIRDLSYARCEIDDALSGREEGDSAAVPPVPSGWRRLAWPILLTAAVTALVTAFLLNGTGSSPAREKGRVVHAQLPLGGNLGLAVTGSNPVFALSPDESQLVMRVDTPDGVMLYLQSLSQQNPRRLAGTEGAESPFFSPDGRWIGFYAGGKLKKAATDGSGVVTLCDTTSARGGAWTPDGFIYFPLTQLSGLWRVSAGGGVPEEVTVADPERGELSHRWPRLLPDGRSLLFTVETAGSFDNARIEALRLDTGERRELVQRGTFPLYAPTGHLIYVRSDALLARSFDPISLEVTGPEIRLAEPVLSHINSGAAEIDLGSEGSLVFLPRGAAVNGYLIRLDPDGTRVRLIDEPMNLFSLDLSPRGDRVALGIDNTEIWIYDLQRRTLSRLTTSPATDQGPRWSPDGRWIYFTSTRTGALNLFRIPADGTGTAERITESPYDQWAGPISSDGRWMLLRQNTPDTGWTIMVLDLEGKNELRTFVATEFDEVGNSFSPDGRWLAYTSEMSGRYEVYLRSFPDSTHQRQVSTGGGHNAIWSPDGRKIYYQSGSRMMEVDAEPDPDGLRLSQPRVVSEMASPLTWQLLATLHAAMPDGDSFIRIEKAENLNNLEIILNWFERLEGKGSGVTAR